MFGDAMRLGVWCLREAVRDWPRTLRYGLMPMAAAVAVPFAVLQDPVLFLLASTLLSAWAGALIHIRWSRYCVLNDDSPRWWGLHLDGNLLRYFGWVVALAALGAALFIGAALVNIFAAALVSELVGLVLIPAAVFGALWLTLKVSPVLVAAALGRPGRLFATMGVMRTSIVLPMILGVLVCVLPPHILGGLAATLLMPDTGADAGLSAALLLPSVATGLASLFALSAYAMLVASLYRNHVAPALDDGPSAAPALPNQPPAPSAP